MTAITQIVTTDSNARTDVMFDASLYDIRRDARTVTIHEANKSRNHRSAFGIFARLARKLRTNSIAKVPLAACVVLIE